MAFYSALLWIFIILFNRGGPAMNKENAFDYCSILDEYYSILLWLSMTFYGVIVIETNVRAHLHAHTQESYQQTIGRVGSWYNTIVMWKRKRISTGKWWKTFHLIMSTNA